LRWTSDRPMVLHLHGYDIEFKVDPQQPATISSRPSWRAASRCPSIAPVAAMAMAPWRTSKCCPAEARLSSAIQRRRALQALLLWRERTRGGAWLRQRFDLPLPLWLWVSGAGATIVLTFAAVALFARDPAFGQHYPRLNLLGWAPLRAAAPALAALVAMVSR